jgi:hypothetical protein
MVFYIYQMFGIVIFLHPNTEISRKNIIFEDEKSFFCIKKVYFYTIPARKGCRRNHILFRSPKGFLRQ